MQQPFQNQLVAGDTWQWTVSACGYPSADGWTLKYFFRGPGKLDIVATTDEDGHFAIVVPALSVAADPDSGTDAIAGTDNLPAGTYTVQTVVSRNAERIELARGTVEILPNIEAQEVGFDGRSWVKRTLDALRAVLEGRASREEMSYQIAGRSLQLMDPRTLVEMEGQFAARYRREQIENGQLPADTNTVVARFGPSAGGDGGWRP